MTWAVNLMLLHIFYLIFHNIGIKITVSERTNMVGNSVS